MRQDQLAAHDVLLVSRQIARRYRQAVQRQMNSSAAWHQEKLARKARREAELAELTKARTE